MSELQNAGVHLPEDVARDMADPERERRSEAVRLSVLEEREACAIVAHRLAIQWAKERQSAAASADFAGALKAQCCAEIAGEVADAIRARSKA